MFYSKKKNFIVFEIFGGNFLMYNNCNVIKVECVFEKSSIYVFVFYWVWFNIIKILFIKNIVYVSWSMLILRLYMYLIYVSSKCYIVIFDKVCYMLELWVFIFYLVIYCIWNICYYYWWVGGCWNYIYIFFFFELKSFWFCFY